MYNNSNFYNSLDTTGNQPTQSNQNGWWHGETQPNQNGWGQEVEQAGFNFPNYEEDYYKPQRPCGGFQEPQRPCGGFPEPQRPCGGFQEPQRPCGGFPEPERPCGGFPEPERPCGGFPEPERPCGGCPKPHPHHRYVKTRIFFYLGNYAYDLLAQLDLPKYHKSLDCSLLDLACGKELPVGHATLEELLCQALAIEEEDDCIMPWLCNERPCGRPCGGCPKPEPRPCGRPCGGCPKPEPRPCGRPCGGCQRPCGRPCGGCPKPEPRPCTVTPQQLAGIKYFLGCKVYGYLKRLDLPCGHESLERSLFELACGKELPYGHPTLDQLLARALKCRCYRD